MNPFITLAGTLLVLFLAGVVLILVARARKWKPTPIKLVWAVSVIVAADLVAGLVCSIYGADVHILYWWLLGLPIVAVCFPLVVVTTTLCVRLLTATFFTILGRLQNKR
jgi:hypothetical protein